MLDGQSLVELEPHERPTTTVFQHFALFPHRSVLENVEFGLKMHGVGKEERRRQAVAALEMVGLETLGDRKPRALSGGQQQRVALARVLVTKPKALLLDEPLGDLDRLLQLRMRVELRTLQRQLGLMFVHVTHNQEEALSMADRIVVMNDAPRSSRSPTADDRDEAGDRGRGAVHGRQQRALGHRHGARRREAHRRDDGGRDRHCRRAGRRARRRRPGLVSVRAAASRLDDGAGGGPNTAECEIVFVEFLGDLVKLHLVARGGADARQGAG